MAVMNAWFRSTVLILAIWAPSQLFGVTAAGTYLSEKDNWKIAYYLEPHYGCTKGRGYYPVATLRDVEAEVAKMKAGKLDCKLFLQVKLSQKSPYDGIVISSRGTQLRGFAIGENTAAMIFGSSKIFGEAHTDRWWASISISSSHKGDCGTDGGFYIKRLDTNVATSADPSSEWTRLSDRGGTLFRLPVPMLQGGFQISQSAKTDDSAAPCQQVVSGTDVAFYVNLQEKKSFLQAADETTVEYYVMPYCVPETYNTSCHSGAMSFSEVEYCASELRLQDTYCGLKLEARLIQESLHDGLVYDAEGSTTAAVALSKEFLRKALGSFFDHPVLWNLEQVDFYGYSQKHTELCASGHLLYKSGRESEPPSKKNPVNWTNWKGVTNGTYDFHFDPNADSYYTYDTTDGSYRANFPPTIDPQSDFEVALRQDGLKCDWEQSRAVVRATVLSGSHLAYAELKDAWEVTYQVSLLSINDCGLNFPECTYRGTKTPPFLGNCVSLVKGIGGIGEGCLVRLDVELSQKRGHDGIRYSSSGRTTFGAAISQGVAEKVFRSHVTYDSHVFLSEIEFNGTATKSDCLFTKNHRLIYRNEIKNETTANLSQWHDVPHLLGKGAIDVYAAKLDPSADFTLAVAQGDFDCKVEQESAFLKVTFLF